MTSLTEDRLERMRAAVLADVHDDVRRRGRRGRRVVSGLAAACLVVVVGGVGYTAVSGGPGGVTASDSSSAEVGAGDAAGGSLESLDQDAATPQSQDAASRLSGELDAEAAPPPAEERATAGTPLAQEDGRDVVTTGTVVAEVDDASEAADALAAWVARAGGRVDQRGEQDAGRDSSAQLVVRVPVDQVDAAVAELRRLGTVSSVDVAREDVTTARADLDARIRNLQTSVDRLRDIVAEAQGTSQLLRAEQSLSARQGELDSLRSQREALADRISLSTLTVDLVSRERAEAVEPSGFAGGLRSGWNGLVGTVNDGVHAAGVLAPWLAVALVVLLPAWLLTRRRRG